MARQSPFSLAGIYEKKFSISPSDAIAAMGSRFAQQVGRKLKSSGFNYLATEPLPIVLATLNFCAAPRVFAAAHSCDRYKTIKIACDIALSRCQGT